jgi:16S rRNA (cytidine1402-2'-O)-methyltransferase
MTENTKGTLFLIPVPIAETDPVSCIPGHVIDQTRLLKYFIAENAKTARKFFKQLGMEQSTLFVSEIDKHDPSYGVNEYLQPLLSGSDMGLMSEAGIPGVADPGAVFVAEAHRKGIRVIPLSGPSSIVLALAASGLNGQQFCFHGYLPKQKEDLRMRLQQMEKQSSRFRQSQIFIETPFRNESLFSELLEVLLPDTRLSISAGLTSPDAVSLTKTIKQWKQSPVPLLKDRPAVFILQA